MNIVGPHAVASESLDSHAVSLRPKLLGLGTATPRHRMSQAESLQMFTDIVCEDERQARLARMLYKKSGVLGRHTCVPHQVAYNWCQSVDADSAEPCANPIEPPAVIPTVRGGRSPGPTTQERMLLYGQFASELAIGASSLALESSATDAADITHLVTVSCTGFDAPGVDIDLIERLGLPGTTQRLHVGFMGCHGAINGLRASLGLTGGNANARVLLCAVELCSLHYRYQWDSEGIIGNALFGDGAAAAVLSRAAPNSQTMKGGGWELRDTGSLVIPDSKHAMSWRVGNHGFDMLLTSEVGDKIEAGLAEWLTHWLAQHELSLQDIDYWGVHPGGPRILSAVQKSLQLDDDALSTSRKVLEDHGNMSSPTVLFILNEFMSQHADGDSRAPKHCILLAFGPGLVAEVALWSFAAG